MENQKKHKKMKLNNSSEQTKEAQVFIISDDPREFQMEVASQAILLEIEAINTDSALQDSFCRCSQFPLTDLIRDAMSGHLFHGFDKHNPERLADKITWYLWGEIIRLYQLRIISSQ